MSKSMFQDVIDFHVKFGLIGEEIPKQLNPELAHFRMGRAKEELMEYMQAYAKDDLAGQLDALVDGVYILLGTAYIQGFNFEEAWKRVHAANMKKVRAARPEDSKYGTTMDIVKPEGWVAPDLSDLVK